MAKQLNVNLAFSADTGAVKKALSDLQNQLTNISKMPTNTNIPFKKEIEEASKAAMELKTHLQNATNAQTGTLDFSKLNQSIKASGTTLSEYGRKLQMIGPDGQKAFMALASSVAQAEIPIKRSNALLTEMATTLKNTARWQISSSMLHGFMGAVQSAYGYAQDLNESLTNIRIVTGQNIDQMSKFAEQANRAAKALNTTTTEYTDASLIYYQQGLNTEEVAKRTEVTVKMANAAGVSAQVASDQLTAIWNNFYDGSKSLEYYADVMTALGAATASSTDEIAGGLEKFAAIGNTIGLSYEYAASALATITSNTRQSEEVVGTALKTIFARIQGLNLGETLEDGTSLNKYSQALEKVGISIFEQNGEIKKMDNILDEMAAKWGTLAKDQQIALAQTVAGVRQYTQLIALMDNWNAGDADSMVANLETAYNSSGVLTEQADIYAESWEAARDRATAAAEEIYKSLVDEKFFIGFLNTIDKILGGVDTVIDSMGGLKGVLTTIGLVATKVFSEQMAQGLRNSVYNLQMATGAGRDHIKKEKVQELEAMGNDLALGAEGEGSEVGMAMRKQYKDQIQLQAELAVRQDEMNASELSHVQQIMDMRKALGDQVIAATEKEIASKDKLYDTEMRAMAEMGKVAEEQGDGILDLSTLSEFDELKAKIKQVEEASVNLKFAQDRYNESVRMGANSDTEFTELTKAIRSAASALNMTDEEIEELLQGIGTDAQQAAVEVDKLMKLLSGRSGYNQGKMQKDLGISSNTAKGIADGYRDIAKAALEKKTAEEQADRVQKLAMERMKSAKGAIHDWATGVTAAASSIMSFVNILNSMSGAIDALTNPDLSGWEKFTTVLSSLSMVVIMTVSAIGSLANAVKGLQKAQVKQTLITIASASAEYIDAAAVKANEKAKLRKARATDKSTKETTEDTAANLAHAASEKVDQKATEGSAEKVKTLNEAFGDLGKSVTKWFNANGYLIGGIALIAAGVAVATIAVTAAINQYNRFENAAKEAAEQAEKAAEAYYAVSEAYNSFTSNLSAYENAQSGLENLTKGTVEYKEAVLKANEAAMKLLNTNEGLTYSIGDDGLIIIDEDSLEKIQEQQLNLLQNAQMSNQLATQNSRDRALDAKQAKFAREELSSDGDLANIIKNTVAMTLAGAGAGALTGAGVGLIAGGGVFSLPATLIGAAIGTLVGGIGGAAGAISAGSAAESEESVLKRIENLYTREGNEKFASDESFEKMLREDLNLNDEALIKSLVDNRESTLQLVKEMSANTAQTKAMNEQMISSELGDEIQRQTNDTEVAKAVTEAMGAGLEAKTNELYESTYKDQIGGKTDAEIQKLYAEAMGWNTNKIDNHSGNTATYYDKEGNEVAAKLDDEVARRFLAQQEAIKQLGLNVEDYVKTIQSLVETGNKLGQGIGIAISSFAGGDGGNLGTLTSEQFNTATSDSILSDFNEESQSFTYNGLTIDDEYAKKMGYENAQAFYNAFVTEIERVELAWENLDLDSMKNAGLKDSIADVLTLDSAQAIKETYEEMGAEGGEAFFNALNTVTDSKTWDTLSLEEQTKLMNEMANIDWSSWDAGDRAVDIARQYGIEIDRTSQAWQENIVAMRDAANALPDLESLRDTMAQIKEISEDIDIGQILSKEDYDLLVKYNQELEKYFVTLSDGSVQFTGDILDFQQEIAETNRRKLIEAKEVYEDRNAEIANQYVAGIQALKGGDLNTYTDSEHYQGDDGKYYYNGQNAQTQIDFLRSQGYDESQLATWENDLSDNNTTVSTLEAIGEAVKNTAGSFNELGIEAEENQKLIAGLMNEIALGAESAEERASLLEEGIIDENAFNYAAMAAHNEEKWEGLDAKEVEVYSKSLRNAAKSSELLSDELAENQEAAEDVALYTKKMNKGIEALSEGIEGWVDILSKSNVASEEYATAMNDIKTAMSDVLGVSEEFISDDFIIEHMEDIKLAAEGNAEAIDRLAIAAARDILINVGFNDEEAKTKALTLHDELASMIPDIEVGATLDDGDFLAKAAQVVETAGMTVEQANAYFRSLGFEPHFAVKEEKVATKKPRIRTHTDYAWSWASVSTPLGTFSVPTFDSIQTSWNEGYDTVDETVEIPSLTTDGGEPNFTLTRTNSGAMNNASSSNKGSSNPKSGGGGGSSSKKSSAPKPIQKTKQSEVVERYKEINDALDDLSDEYEKASRSADRLWGEHRLDALRKQNALIEEQQELLAKKQKEAANYMEQDRAALQSAAAAVGLAFSFDENGNITNYTDQMTALYEQLSNAEDYYNSLATGEDQDSYEETILGPLRDKIATIEDAIALYDESRELFEELGLEIDDLQDQIMQNNYDIIMEGLELHISFNEEDLEVIDYYLSKIEDDFYKMHEAAALMIGPQLNEYKDNLKEYTEAMNELHRAYAAGEITEAMYQEGLEEVRAGIRDNLSSIIELDKTMMEYYGETVAMAQEELAKYTAQMENHVAVLEHYQNLMSILGKETDFEALGIILEGQAKTAENAMKVSKENYEMYKRQVEAVEEKIANATTDEEKAFLEKEWEAANTAMMEAQQDMLDKTEAWAESLRAILENKLSGFAQDLENALTGGTSFDTLTTSMERAASLQEEYLTTTNQIYETNKLMRTAQQAIDASTSNIAKNKLKQFINETKQLQDQNKLSEYELEIQQAKYNLILAEMALEDARDAKTVVRLKRDNEGNLGYVYTADQDKLAEAQQELEDAQNSLYNIGLEGANEYSEKYQQTMSEMYDTFTELQEQYLSGEFETEAEYQDAMLKAKEYYYEKLKNYSSLHQVALTTDARVVADAWSSEYSDMIFNTEDWMRHVTDYVHNVNDAFTEWNNNVDMITNETLGPDLDSLESNVKDITNANDELTKSITGDGGVIDAIEEELDQVSNLTGKYATLRQQIQGLIADHEQMMVRMGNEPNPYTPPGTGTAGSGSSGGSSSSSSGGSSSSSSSSSGGSGSSSGAYGSSGSGSDDVNAPDYSDLTKQGVALAIWNGGFGWGNGTTRRNRLDEKGFDPEEIQRIIDVTNPNGDWRTRYGISDLTKYAYSSFDTGGYTGAWGSYGKFAMLHEKELILNPGETENFLASMEVLRSIIKMIDLQSTASQLGGLLHSPGYYAPQTSEVLEQNVHIEASFPEATDRYEIEAALTSIVNRASQYANRK